MKVKELIDLLLARKGDKFVMVCGENGLLSDIIVRDASESILEIKAALAASAPPPAQEQKQEGGA